MKKFLIFMIAVIAFVLLPGCTRTVDDISKEISELMSEQAYLMRLENINEISGENYRNLDKALKEEMRKYEEAGLTEDLLAIYKIIGFDEKYKGYVTEYYGQIFDRQLTDEKLAEQVGYHYNDLLYYIKQLRAEGKQDEYQEFYLHMDKYSDPKMDMTATLLWFKDDIHQLSDAEKLFHIDTLIMFSDKYESDLDITYLAAFHKNIYLLANSLEKYELGSLYESKYEECLKKIQERSDRIEEAKKN